MLRRDTYVLSKIINVSVVSSDETLMFTSEKQELLSTRSPQLKFDYPAW